MELYLRILKKTILCFKTNIILSIILQVRAFAITIETILRIIANL